MLFCVILRYDCYALVPINCFLGFLAIWLLLSIHRVVKGGMRHVIHGIRNSQKSRYPLTLQHDLTKGYIKKQTWFIFSVPPHNSSRMDCLTCKTAFKKGDQKFACAKCAKWEHRRCHSCKNIFLFYLVFLSVVIFSILSQGLAYF